MANLVLMVSPDHFGFNEETALSNSFQKKMEREDLQRIAFHEFQNAVKTLQQNGIEVKTFSSPAGRQCPDAVFPNNWFSTHPDGKLILYPMCTPNRRAERNPEIIEILKKQFKINEIIDLSGYEEKNEFLEGTGSIVFDHESKIAYACISPRTNEKLLNQVCEKLGYRPFVFEALDLNSKPVYHTNVVMAIGKNAAIVCLDCIENPVERNLLKESLEKNRKTVVPISHNQMNSFAGNMLELSDRSGKQVWVMSQTAFNALNQSQKEILSRSSRLLPLEIPTIETVGGGSARCMLAEIFLNKIP